MTEKRHRWTNSGHHIVVNLMRDREDAIFAQMRALPDEKLWHTRGRVVEAITRVAGRLARENIERG